MKEEYIKGVEFSEDGKTLKKFPRSYQGDYSVPEGVTTIGNRAFQVCDGMTRIVFPESLEVIEDSAFVACDGLTLSSHSYSRQRHRFGEPRILRQQGHHGNLPSRQYCLHRSQDLLCL